MTVVFKEKGAYASMPSIVRAENKTLLVSFRLAPCEAKGYSHLHSQSASVIARSMDNGKTWSAPEVIAEDDLLAKQDPQLLLLPDGRIVCYYFRYLFHPEGERKTLERDRSLVVIPMPKKRAIASLRGVGYAISADNGKTFSRSRVIALTGISSFAARGACGVSENGVTRMPIYAAKTGRDRYALYVIEGRFGERAWRVKGKIAESAIVNGTSTHYFEPALLCASDGVLHAFVRAHTKEGIVTLRAFSNTNGASFSPLIPFGVNGHPAHPLQLSDGRILLTYGYRARKGSGVRARFAKTEKESIIIGDEFILDDLSPTPDTGYPWGVQIDDTTALSVYYREGAIYARLISL